MFDLFKSKFVEQAKSRGYSRHEDDNNPNVFTLGFYTVVLGELTEYHTREETLSQVEELLGVILSLRKQFNAARASDIYLLMMAPPGSCNDTDWKTLASEIERDDRLARKHVWLPDNDLSDFSGFINQTFMADPWTTGEGEGEINALSLLSNDIDMPAGWENALLDADLEGRDLVLKLIELGITK
jgi:hypothetical protein